MVPAGRQVYTGQPLAPHRVTVLITTGPHSPRRSDATKLDDILSLTRGQRAWVTTMPQSKVKPCRKFQSNYSNKKSQDVIALLIMVLHSVLLKHWLISLFGIRYLCVCSIIGIITILCCCSGCCCCCICSLSCKSCL